MNEFENHSYLWDGSSKEWGLLHANPDKPNEEPRYLIYNTKTKRALLIRDEELSSEVKSKMIEQGVVIISPHSLR